MADEFDVFLSHNSRDKPIVEQIGAWLKEQGLRSNCTSRKLGPDL